MIDRLKNYWSSHGLELASGADPDSLQEFERKNTTRLPDDFRNYLLAIDGMKPYIPNDCDKEGFSFWSIQRIKSIRQEKPDTIWPAGLPAPSQCFIFADYLQWSWAYAIDLSTAAKNNGAIFSVGVLKPNKISDSFSEFIKLYLEDSNLLYPEWNP